MMKNLFTAFLLALPFGALAQSPNFTVTGHIGNLDSPAKVYLNYGVNGKSVTDSAALNNGNFEFKGSIIEPVLANLVVNSKGNGINAANDVTSFFIGKGETIVSSNDSAKNAKISGTKISEDYVRYLLEMKPVIAQQEVIDAKVNSATAEKKASGEFQSSINRLTKAADEQESRINQQFIMANPASFVSLAYAIRDYAPSADYKEVKALFDHLTPELQQSHSGQKFAEQLAMLKLVALGTIAPEFAQADTNGQVVKLSAFHGKYVLIDFWASWCGPCRLENPNLVKAYSLFKDKGFTILGISLDRPDGKEKWLKAIHNDKLTWTQLSDLKFFKNEVALLYGIQAIPQNFLLDPEGRIIGKNLKEEDLIERLNQVTHKKGTSENNKSK